MCRMNARVVCRSMEVVYLLRCMEGPLHNSQLTYLGETAKNLEKRVEENFQAYRGRKRGSVLYEHAVGKPVGRMGRVNISTLSKNKGDANDKRGAKNKRDDNETIIRSCDFFQQMKHSYILNVSF